MAADAEHAAGASGVRRVQVRAPNPYGVPLGAARIVVVDLSQYRMYFFSHGREVRSFPCVLGRPSLPTPRGHFRIFAKGMNPGGPYGARIMSYHSAVRDPRHQRAVAAQALSAQLLARLHAALQRQRDLAVRPRPHRHAGVERAVSETSLNQSRPAP